MAYVITPQLAPVAPYRYGVSGLGSSAGLGYIGPAAILIVWGTMMAPIFFLLGVSLKIRYLGSHCSPESYDEADCKRYKELKEAGQKAADEEGNITPNSLLASRTALEAIGEDVSAFPASFSGDFSISLSDLSSFFAAVPSSAYPAGTSPQDLDAVVQMLAPGEPLPSTIDPSTVTVSVDPVTGVVEASAGPSPIVVIGGIALAAALVFAAYKYA